MQAGSGKTWKSRKLGFNFGHPGQVRSTPLAYSSSDLHGLLYFFRSRFTVEVLKMGDREVRPKSDLNTSFVPELASRSAHCDVLFGRGSSRVLLLLRETLGSTPHDAYACVKPNIHLLCYYRLFRLRIVEHAFDLSFQLDLCRKGLVNPKTTQRQIFPNEFNLQRSLWNWNLYMNSSTIILCIFALIAGAIQRATHRYKVDEI